jgi:ABC-2 type transport system ATP-binding protein
MTARDLLGYMEDAYPDWDPAKVNELLRRFEISLQAPLGTQSKGSQAKLKLILALSRNAKYILLDEPLLGIDPLTKRDLIWLVLREFKEDWQTVVMATHDIYDLEQLFDEVAFLAKGQIKAVARPEQLREEGKGAMSWLEEVYRL